MPDMNSTSQLRSCALEVVSAARRFDAAAQAPESHRGAPASLAALEDAFQLLSAAWYRLAADAAPDLAERRQGTSEHAARPDRLSHEQEVRVLATLHDIAAAFARTARTCRTGRSRIEPIIEGHVAAMRAISQQGDDALWRVREHEQPGRHVA
jgi:hypothetical protein